MAICKFSIGHLVRCIRDDGDEELGITINKEYVVKAVTETFLFTYVWIINNDGEEVEYFSDRFCSVNTRRNLVINEILE